MNIDFILGNKKSKPSRKKSRSDPLINLFKGQGNPFLGDRITRKQAKVFKGPSKDLFGDWDGDGVINGLDCQPRNSKKHMAWEAPKPYEHIEHMAPREYLRRTHTPKFGLDGQDENHSSKYYDSETSQMEPISKLSKHITDKQTKVEIPNVEDDGNHEGRHRAFAAERVGIKSIPVMTPPPKSWRSDKVVKTFIKKRYPHQDNPDRKDWQKRMDTRDNEKYSHRIKTDVFPHERLDLRGLKAYGDAIQEHNPDQEVRDTIIQEDEE